MTSQLRFQVIADTEPEQWSEAKCLRLIRAYRKRPVLWDDKNAFYYKRDAKENAWQEIATGLQTNVESCRRKMTILIASFRKEKNRILSIPGDSSTIVKTWYAYKDLSFLLDKDKARKETVLDTDDEDDNASTDAKEASATQLVYENQLNFRMISSETDEPHTSQDSKMPRHSVYDDEQCVTEQDPTATWTEEKSLELIREFRNRTVLWDPKNSLYYRKSIKQAAWDEIGEVLKANSEFCKRKMSTLMSSFRREKAKLVNCLKYCDKDSTSSVKSYWFAFKAMSFLLDKDSERKRQAMGRKESPPLLQLDATTDSVNAASIENNEDTTRKRRRISETDNQDSDTSASEQQLHTTSSKHIDDEMKYFTKFIISKMMKYDEATKNLVQQKICEIIFKTDQTLNFQTLRTNDSVVDSINEALTRASDDRHTTIKIHYSDSE